MKNNMERDTGVQLKVLSGGAKGKVFDFNKNIITVGCDPSADIRIQDDPEIAPVHIEIQKRGAQFILLDRSGRGTVVNTRCVEQIVLQDACQVRLTPQSFMEIRTGIDVRTDSAERLSLFRRPIVLIGGAIYGIAMISAVIYLSSSQPMSSPVVDSAQESQLVQSYLKYLEKTNGPKPEEKVGKLEDYLRSAHLAAKSGHMVEAETIYLSILGEQSAESSRSGLDKRDNPVYQYAMSRLNALK